MRGSIDIGSNSLLLLVGNFDDQGRFHEKLNLANVTGLGKNIDQTGLFSNEAMTNTLEVLRDYRSQLDKIGLPAEEILVTATEAARVTKNAQTFFAQVRKELGFQTQILSPQGEAYYSALGVTLGTLGKTSSQNQLLIMDLGGASTEFVEVTRDPFKVGNFVSLPIGSVRAIDWLQAGIFEQKLKDVVSQVKGRVESFDQTHLMAIAGTMTTLAAMVQGLSSYDDRRVHQSILSQQDLKSLLEQIEPMSPADLLKAYPFLGKRVYTIYGGAKVAYGLAQAFGMKRFEISTFGLRYGTLYSGSLRQEFVIGSGQK